MQSKLTKKLSPTAPKRRGLNSEQIYQSLRQDIIEMKLLPGEALDETTLAQRFGVSRSPIREALIRLQANSFIINEQNRCPIIAPFDMSHLPKFFEALSLMQRMTARLAASHRTSKDLAVSEKIHLEHQEAYKNKDIMLMVKLNREFHASIGSASKNPYFESLYARLLDESFRLIRFHFYTYDDELPEEYVQDHIVLLEAIANRDADAADLIAKEHAQKVWDQFVNYLINHPLTDVKL